jgi:hypothetical protein
MRWWWKERAWLAARAAFSSRGAPRPLPSNLSRPHSSPGFGSVDCGASSSAALGLAPACCRRRLFSKRRLRSTPGCGLWPRAWRHAARTSHPCAHGSALNATAQRFENDLRTRARLIQTSCCEQFVRKIGDKVSKRRGSDSHCSDVARACSSAARQVWCRR